MIFALPAPRPPNLYELLYLLLFSYKSTPLLQRFPLVYRHAETGVGGVPFGLGAGGWGGWVLVGWTGLVLQFERLAATSADT